MVAQYTLYKNAHRMALPSLLPKQNFIDDPTFTDSIIFWSDINYDSSKAIVHESRDAHIWCKTANCCDSITLHFLLVCSLWTTNSLFSLGPNRTHMYEY